tara:strand:- start:279 stop:464 length:186 start_codon:yes stop_codon:yes gene_type:complete
MIRIKKFYPSKPFFKMSIEELQIHVRKQKMKWKRYERKRKRKYTRKRRKEYKKKITRKNLV